ncbi:hypothetical protein QE152_g40435 [Popillia japonica]|uniref:Retrotransposon gag domain-containing protein n=1 Tax=Popillia japonica TaxID=7064 RepID=A0AAW1HR48_POPJA
MESKDVSLLIEKIAAANIPLKLSTCLLQFNDEDVSIYIQCLCAVRLFARSSSAIKCGPLMVCAAILPTDTRVANQAVINIPLPAPIDVKSGDIIDNLRLFKESWEVYVVASTLEKEEEKRKVAVLLSAIGSECFKLFQNWPVSVEEKRTVQGIFDALGRFLAPQTNNRYERAIFNLAKQESEEDIDKYINRLRKLVKNCEYGTMQDR